MVHSPLWQDESKHYDDRRHRYRSLNLKTRLKLDYRNSLVCIIPKEFYSHYENTRNRPRIPSPRPSSNLIAGQFSAGYNLLVLVTERGIATVFVTKYEHLCSTVRFLWLFLYFIRKLKMIKKVHNFQWPWFAVALCCVQVRPRKITSDVIFKFSISVDRERHITLFKLQRWGIPLTFLNAKLRGKERPTSNLSYRKNTNCRADEFHSCSVFPT